MEDLLETIADNVSAIVLALARKGRTVGDIVPATEMISGAVERMCASSRNTAKNPEIQAEARRVLEETSGELSAAGAKLVAAARSARDAKGRGDEAGVAAGQRSAMHESKELLQKVTLLLMLEDQININFLVQSGKRVTEAARRLSGVESLQQLAQVAPEASVHHQDFLRRVRLRADVTRDGSDDKTRLLDAVAALQRAGPAHTAAAQRMVSPGGGGGGDAPSARAEAERVGAEIEGVVDDVIRLARAIFARNARFIGEAFAFRAPTTNTEDRLVQCAADFLQASARVVPLCAAEGAMSAYVEAGEHEARAARGVAVECSDPLQRRMIELCAAELEGLLPRVQAIAGEVRANAAAGQEDATKTAFLRMLTAVTQGCGEALRLTGVLTPEEAVAANGLLCTRRMAELSRALEAGDGDRARAELAAFDQDVARYIALAELRAEDPALDPAERAAAQRAIERLRGLRPRIVAAATKVLGASGPAERPAALDALLAVARELTATRDLLSEYSVQGAALATIARVECEGLTDAVRLRATPNYQQLAIEHAKDAARALQQMQLVARAALGEEEDADADNNSDSSRTLITDPAHRREVEEALAQSTPAVAALVNATKVAIQRPGDAQAYQALEAASERTKACADRIAALLRPTDAELAAARARADEEKKKILEEEEEKEKEEKKKLLVPLEGAEGTAEVPRPGRVVLTVEGPHDEHILHAAQTVVDTLGEVEGKEGGGGGEKGKKEEEEGAVAGMEDTPQGRVYRASHEIADLMTELAALAALNNKEGMISTGRKIATSTNAITTYAQPIAAQCSDPILRGDVVNNAQSAQNYAVQLKILCAVKAASAEGDPDDESVKDQLVTAANGLASSIVGTAKSCQSASIHIRTHNNNN